MTEVKYVFYVLISDVLNDDQVDARFVETNSLPIIKRAYSLKAAKQPKETAKVSLVHLAMNYSVVCQWLFSPTFFHH